MTMIDGQKQQDIRYCFSEDATAEIYRRMKFAGEGVRLSLRIDLNEDLFARVIPHHSSPDSFKADLAALPEINNAHRCPPFDDCPP